MPSLLDHIDRFSYTAQQIQSSSRQALSSPHGPYVHTILSTDIGDMARDIDASELGLFTLVPQASAHTRVDDSDASSAVKNEITRVEFQGATPLRKPAGGKKFGKDAQDKEPEVYAAAALKYLDRYQSIRPMPRARQEVEALLVRLSTLREKIEAMTESVEQSTQTGSEPKASVKDEEKRVQELQSRAKQLKARRDILLRKQRPTVKNVLSVRATPDKREDEFWRYSDQQAKSKKRQSLVLPTSADDSLLLDSPMNIGDVSMDSLPDAPTPLPQSRTPAVAPRSKEAKPPLKFSNAEPPALASPEVRDVVEHTAKRGEEPQAEDDQAPQASYDDEGDKTIMLNKPPVSVTSPSPPPQTSSPISSAKAGLPETPARNARFGNVPVTPAETPGPSTTATPGTGKSSRMKVTSDMERIVAKLWSTVGDVIMPGHPFNTAIAATHNKPPRAKETIALLQNISTSSPPPGSPSTHSTLSLTEPTSSGQPTAHQILTAHLLLTLLTLPPTYSLPLNKAKEALASKGLGPPSTGGPTLLIFGTGGQGLETRALYGCIAKRLLKVDRGGKEQILRFDV